MDISTSNNSLYQNKAYVLTVNNGVVSTVFQGNRNETTGIDLVSVALEKSGISDNYNKK